MSQTADCDVCLIGTNCRVVASFLCRECKQAMCNQCSNKHISMTVSKTHHLSPVEDATKNTSQNNWCDEHPKKERKFYCRECNTSLCSICRLARHIMHTTCKIEEIVKEMKNDVYENIQYLHTITLHIDAKSEHINEQKKSLTDLIGQMKTDIMKRVEEIKLIVDKQAADLIEELNSHGAIILRNIQNTEEELQRCKVVCDNFEQSCLDVDWRADSAEISRAAGEMKTRVEELKKLSIPEILKLPKIKFIPSDIDMACYKENIVGKLSDARFVLIHAIGQGGYGVVYKAKFITDGDSGTKDFVAYKKLHTEYIDDENVKIFREEAELHSRLEHQNIIKCLGTKFEPGNYGIIFEFAEYGELRGYLRKNNDLKINLSMLHDVALGMEYLHGIKPNPVIHGDLKIQNVLVGIEKIAKICDFGFSRIKDYSQSRSVNEVRLGTVTHIPPEYWNDRKLLKNEKFDVYSFGITAWEIITLKRPFENARNNQGIIENWVVSGLRPPLNIFPSKVPERIRDVIQGCWAMVGISRPSFTDVVQRCVTYRRAKPHSFKHKNKTENSKLVRL